MMQRFSWSNSIGASINGKETAAMLSGLLPNGIKKMKRKAEIRALPVGERERSFRRYERHAALARDCLLDK